MKKFVFLFVIMLIGFSSFADVSPAPSSAASALTMNYEKVDIILYPKEISVRANFKLGGKKVPTLQYCGVYPSGEHHCSEPYREFYYGYPVLKGQNISDFSAYVDGEEVKSFLSPDSGMNPMPKLASVDNWIAWGTKRYPVTDAFNTEVTIHYSEPMVWKNDRSTFTYVLRSGALWKGKIGKAFLHVYSPGGMKISNCSIEPMRVEPEKGMQYFWTFSDWEPVKDLTCEVSK